MPPVYRPYPKQIEFHEAGLAHRERLFLAGNQLGKTLAGAFEEAAHATGKYPWWWRGRRFEEPSVSWVAGVTGESTRDTVQRALIGRSGRGGGALRRTEITRKFMARGAPGLVDTIHVRHVSGGVSTIAFKSYEKGREKWQGETLDRVWFDEEPPADIYANERRNMTQATALAPTLANQDYANLQQLASVGDARQQIGQQQINADINRYNYDQNLPYNNLANYMRMIQGNYGTSATQTTQNAVNPLAGTLGFGTGGLDLLPALGSLASSFLFA